MQDIKNYIHEEKTQDTTFILSYSSVCEDVNSETGVKSFKIENKVKTIALETYKIKSKVKNSDLEQIANLHGVDPKQMITSALENEEAMQEDKLIYDIIKFAGEQNQKLDWSFKDRILNKFFKIEPKIKISKDSEILGVINKCVGIIERKKNGRETVDFIIVSHRMWSMISQLPQFVPNDPNKHVTSVASGFILKNGSLSGKIDLLVNPNLTWENESLVLGSKTYQGQEGIYLFFQDKEINEREIYDQSSGRETLVIEFMKRLCVFPTENAHTKYYTVKISQSKDWSIFSRIKRIFGK
jgi:hypothetical protein